MQKGAGMIKLFKDKLNSFTDLEDRIFFMILSISVVVNILTIIFTALENIGVFSLLTSIFSLVFILILLYLSLVLDQMKACRLIFVYFLNCLILPVAFITSGGVDSGIPLYLLGGLFLIVPILREPSRTIAFSISFLVDCIVIGISYFFMKDADNRFSFAEDIYPELSSLGRIIDVLSSFAFMTIFVCGCTIVILMAYRMEREKGRALVEKMSYLAIRDELTDLYDRHYFFTRIEKMNKADLFKSDSFYLALIDIDNFKQINDKYGNLFGDMALKKIAEQLNKTMDEYSGEIVARYSGDEFIYLINAVSLDVAATRIERIRRTVEDISLEAHPDLKITISGGVTACSDSDDMTTLLASADKALCIAKKNGRNRVVTEKDYS